MSNQIDFDPKRAANWFGGIARAIREQGVDWASVDNLADRTLRTMNILTRSKPRERLLAEIKKAIRSLCRQGILSEYRIGKVRIADAGRLDRYLTSSPKPLWAESGAADSPETTPGRGGNASYQRSPEPAEGGLLPGLSLPDLLPTDDDEDGEPSATNSVAPDDDEDPERDAIRLLMGGSPGQTASVGLSTSPAPVTPQAAVGAAPQQDTFLDELAATLHQASSAWRVSAAGDALTGSCHRETIKIERRRDGSLRGALEFPVSDLARVLRQIRSSWQLASVGVDSRGIPAVLYRWPRSAAATDVVDDIERGLGLLDDARTDV